MSSSPTQNTSTAHPHPHPHPHPQPPSPPKTDQILILGAGVTGLSTAISLLTHPSTSHLTITIIAAHLPGDLSPAYTSPWAGGDWHSHASLSDEDADIRRWDGRTYEAIKQNTETRPSIGLNFTTLRYFWGSFTTATQPDGSGIWFSSLVHDFHVLDLEEERREGRPVPKDAVFGTRFRSMTFDPVVYLGHLLGRVRKLGGRIVKAREMKRVVAGGEEEGREGELLAVVNCAGLSAREFLPSDEASKLFPIRGQTVLVKGEARDAHTYVSIPSISADEVVYVIPRPGSGTTVLGGCKQAGSWEEGVDAELGERIMERVMGDELAEELRTGEGGGFEVVRHQVGFRPGRRGGPRVEVEKGGRVGGVWVVHNYGHGAGGYQASVGCAERVVELVGELL
ncbi:hypothetical protein BKA65DRAFT_397953 [Rhexocercosporidium sp. MPI-PUGE-AT-0058]|nr:hypothetical protein BKA65DRAFT_397953 [Rhexocercosporidium sp. MPI-PUGE-AT-0058]